MKPGLRRALSAAMSAVIGVAAQPSSAAERALDKSVVVHAPLDDVWAAWTTREGITSFMAPDAQIEPRVGGAFHVYFDPLGEAGEKGADDMRYMALQPKRMLSFDWNAPPHLAEARRQRTFVMLRFEPVAERETRVLMHHTGWGDGGQWDEAYQYFDRAWNQVLANLQKRFDSGPVDWTEWMQKLKAMHAQPAASATR